MTEQRQRILESVEYIKKHMPKKFVADTALLIENDIKIEDGYKVLSKIDYDKIPPAFENNDLKKVGSILFVKIGQKPFVILKGRFHYYDGISMRELGHVIYVLQQLNIKKIISIDEVAYLNPRFQCGDLALIYDHINLMGDNPLIGENDDELGLRFPDMSNAYDVELFEVAYSVFQDNMMKMNESVFLGVIGPESETEAEARFYREIGADVVGYSLVPEDITAVHSNIKFLGIGLITRELIADKMIEDESTEAEKEKLRKKYLKKCEIDLNKIIGSIVKKI
ncbi:MAG: purine-nucleoside phosphorylase [Ignavibacteria bacterium]|nr:purine-nucleoside phosphorylase [Ignavibacteria bacterium]